MNNSFIGYIYKITNDINGKIYIGQTTRTVEKRWKEHLYLAKKDSSLYLHRSMRKYDARNFSIEIIGISSNIDTLNKYEQRVITK